MNPLSVLLINLRNKTTNSVAQHLAATAPELNLTPISRLDQASNQLPLRIWDAVLLDMDLRDEYALETIAGIRDIRPNLPIMLLAETHEHTAASRALMAGADDYVIKGRNNDDIVQQLSQLTYTSAPRVTIAG